MENEATELQFLKYFYLNADFGPADGDCRYYIKKGFMKDSGLKLPKGYTMEEEE
jgi:hypothetical protein